MAVAVGATGWAAAPSTAQAQTLTGVWREFYQACAEDPDNRLLCACAATEFTQRCQQQGARTGDEVATCIARNQDAWVDPVVALCTGYGALHVAGPVSTPAPRAATAGGEHMSQGILWSAAYEGCESRIGAGEHREYACACVATYVVQSCAPAGPVPTGHVSQCVPALGPDIQRVTPSCGQFGALATGAPTVVSAPAAGATPPPAAAVHPGAAALCNGMEVSSLTVAQRNECLQVASSVLRRDVDAFLGYLPSGGPIRLLRNARATSAAVRAHFARNGGLDALVPSGSPAIYASGTPAAPTLVVYDQDIVDVPVVEASFRWVATVGRWELTSIAVAPRE